MCDSWIVSCYVACRVESWNVLLIARPPYCALSCPHIRPTLRRWTKYSLLHSGSIIREPHRRSIDSERWLRAIPPHGKAVYLEAFNETSIDRVQDATCTSRDAFKLYPSRPRGIAHLTGSAWPEIKRHGSVDLALDLLG